MEINPNHAEAQYQYGLALAGQASVGADGKVTAAPGTVEAFKKYLELKPSGPNAASAKGMIEMLQ
ncbi:hypothetical protein D3C83_237080 [compost metagenome]